MRVHLQPATAADLPRLFEIRNSPECTAMAGIVPQSWERFVEIWNRDDVTARAIVGDDELVGTITIFPRDGVWEMGYIIDTPFWGQGIATSAVRQMLAIFDARPVHAVVSAANRASGRVLEKAGFERTGQRSDGAWQFIAR
jgi:RimJ/RimL family protein N-acetyltransferase